MTLTITPEVEALLQQELKSGRFHDPNEVIATALLVLANSRHNDLRELDIMIQEGVDSADRDELFTEDEARTYIGSVRAKL